MKLLRQIGAGAFALLLSLSTMIAPAHAAAGNFLVYGAGLEAVADGTIDLDTDSFRAVLVTSSYTPNQNTDDTWSDVSANEVSGTGYTANGVSASITLSRSNLVVTADTADVSWSSSTITAKYLLIVHDADGNGSLATTDRLLTYVDLDTGGGSVSTTNGTFTVTINASGLFTLTAS